MTKGEVNSLCLEIDRLLNDICKFLNEESDAGYLSENGRKVASILIERSKQQLEAITITLDSDTSEPILESYVDMQSYKVNPNENYPEPQEVYSDVSLIDEPTFRSATDDEQLICPFINLRADEIKSGRTGYLYKKEKMWFFDQQRKVYAAIQYTWFLIYLNEHSLKPIETYDLSLYKVRTSQKDNKKREESFELVSLADLKTYQFTAHTSKDMHQWIAALNLEIDSLVITRNMPYIPAKHNEDDFVRLSTESNNDYEPLKNYIIKERKNSSEHKEKKDPPLPLPPRNATIKKSPHLQKYRPRTPSTESLSSNYDSVGSPLILPSREASNSFSEDDSDTHYDDPSELRSPNLLPFVKQYESNKDDDDDNEIYDYLEKPSFPPTTNQPVTKIVQKQPKTEVKPKPLLKPKLVLSLRNRKKNGV